MMLSSLRQSGDKKFYISFYIHTDIQIFRISDLCRKDIQGGGGGGGGDVLGTEGTAPCILDICISIETSSHVCILDRRLEVK
jgi:hypothetical protein